MSEIEVIIDSIEYVRSKNNVNWMDILRIAMKYAPEETKRVLKQIGQRDEQIFSKLKELANS